MMDFSLGQVIGLLLRTLPFLLLRLGVYLGITLAYVIATGGGAGLGWLAGKAASEAPAGAMWGALIGFGLISGVLYWAREYLLYLVKAGHIAVLAELLLGREIPQGRSQLDHGAAVVRERFVESSVLFGVDQLVKGILRVFNRAMLAIANFLPIPGLDGLLKFVNTVINTSLTYVDEVILAHAIRTGSTDAWASARDAVVLYAQNYKTMLKNAVWLTFIVWGLTLLIFLLVLGPVAALVSLFPAVAGFWTFALAIVAAVSIKAAIVDPLAMAALMQVFFKVSQGQSPDPAWSAKLEGMSDKFKELKAKAAGTSPQAVPGALTATPPPPPPA
jgi:hypothetical protein